jgi:hypothetical protein
VRPMNAEEELVLIFGALHLIAAALGAFLLYLFLRSEDTSHWRQSSDDDDSGGGGNDRVKERPKRKPPSGGLPLPDAVQSSVRLRGYGRLADAHPRRGRRTAPEPHRAPTRIPSRR